MTTKCPTCGGPSAEVPTGCQDCQPAPVALPAEARDEDETVPPIPLHWAEGGTVRHSQPASPPADTALRDRLTVAVYRDAERAWDTAYAAALRTSGPSVSTTRALTIAHDAWRSVIVRALTAGASPEEQDADDGCEGCNAPFTDAEARYVTLDDVHLCRRCYESAPSAARSAGEDQ